MSYVVTARRWRPQTFEELVGQEHVSRTLMNAVREGRVAHAFLMTGVRGVGKTTAARILAKALNCERGPTPTPCNSCANCREITAGSAVDVLEIDGASNTGVDDVRQIIENVRYSPAKSRFKIYIIDEVHMLSNSAFNALLKTLEEPPSHVKFIFATTDPHKLPATVQSRCQRYDFRRIPLGLVVERLRRIVDEEGVKISDRALGILAREGEGSMRDAQSLLDQVLAYGGQEIGDEQVLATLGIADRKFLYEIGEAIIGQNAARALELVNELHLHGYDMRRVTRELVEHFRNLAVAKLTRGDLLPDLPVEEREAVSAQAEKIGAEQCDRVFRVLLETDEEITRSSYPKLLLEMALIKVATLPPLLPLEELVERIEEVEGRLRSSAPGADAAVRKVAPREPVATERTKPVEREPQRRPAAPAEAAPTRKEGSSEWRDFVDFVARERVPLAHHLGLCSGRLAGNGVLTIAAPRGFEHDYLARRDHIAEIQSFACRHFQRDVRVSITPAEGEATTAENGQPTREVSAAALKEGVLGNPVVKAAVEILGGEVQEVRPRGRRREDR
jgi:DNA polymerase III subunit gamma/tau